MELGALLLLLALLAGVVAFVGRPLVLPGRTASGADPQTSALLAERERLLEAVRELDLDHQLGKIPASDYPEQRALLLRRGVEILRQLDERQPAAVAPVDSAARRSGTSNETLEEMIARRRSARKEKAGGFCPKCGKPVLAADRFCPSCGQALHPS